jgi:hypothetical protein
VARTKSRLNRKLVLTLLWWTWGLLLVVFAVALSQDEVLFPNPADVWSWFVPNIFPTMTLVGAGAYGGRNTPARAGEGSTALFILAVAASALYLALLTQALANALITMQPTKSLSTANLWLGPLQGIVTSLLGFFFITSGSGGAEDAPRARTSSAR